MELIVILVSLMMVIMSPKLTLSLSVKSKLNPRIVQTRYGKIQGLTQTFDYPKYLQPIDVYLGIPYATPPILSNRFSPTRAPSPWDGVKLADSVGPVCPQKLPDITNEQEALERMPKGRYEYLRRLLPHLRNQSEDCLYLNIYGPAMVEAYPSKRSSDCTGDHKSLISDDDFFWACPEPLSNGTYMTWNHCKCDPGYYLDYNTDKCVTEENCTNNLNKVPKDKASLSELNEVGSRAE